jgi:hypothetical protein
MESYDLSRLSAGSFERLVRALAFHALGPGGTVFSSGPDGGRDFTYERAIKGYETKGWDGYLVLQAKFREKPKGGEDDIEWLKEQLAAEEQKFLDSAAGLRRPNFYIIATNIALSGADGRAAGGGLRKGGYTKVAEELETWKASLGLTDYDIWPADKIIDLLVDAPGVRQSYAAWTTVGDVLTAVLERYTARSPDFATVIRRAMKNSLRRDQYARLKDAGSVSDPQIRTSQVFIDLPVQGPKSRTEDLEELVVTGRKRPDGHRSKACGTRKREA